MCVVFFCCSRGETGRANHFKDWNNQPTIFGPLSPFTETTRRSTGVLMLYFKPYDYFEPQDSFREWRIMQSVTVYREKVTSTLESKVKRLSICTGICCKRWKTCKQKELLTSALFYECYVRLFVLVVVLWSFRQQLRHETPKH